MGKIINWGQEHACGEQHKLAVDRNYTNILLYHNSTLICFKGDQEIHVGAELDNFNLHDPHLSALIVGSRLRA